MANDASPWPVWARVTPALRPAEARDHRVPHGLLSPKPDSCKNHPADDNCTRKSRERSLSQKVCPEGKPRVSTGRVFLTSLGAFFPALAKGGEKKSLSHCFRKFYF